MPQAHFIPNRAIAEAILAVPAGHRHLRLALRLADGSTLVLAEAAVAAIVRAYTTVKTHPQVLGLRLRGVPLDERKPGFAEHQLLEVAGSAQELAEEMARILAEAAP
ncbi:MAG: hypothetical protein AB1634_05585 [Thermodesulfobacteriota bacterium]